MALALEHIEILRSFGADTSSGAPIAIGPMTMPDQPPPTERVTPSHSATYDVLVIVLLRCRRDDAPLVLFN